MRKNIVGLLLLLFILSNLSCHKKVTAGLVPLMPKLSIGEEVDYVVENPPSTPPMSEETLQTILKADFYEDIGHSLEDGLLIPIRLNCTTFEYLTNSNLFRFDILGHQKSEYKDVFKNVAWVDRKDQNLLGDDENWIVSDEQNYYYLEEFEAKENEHYKISFFLVCKNRNTFQIKWRIKIIDEDNVYVQRIVQNKDSIFVFTRSDLSVRCIDKQTGLARWKFEVKKEVPYISLPLTYHNCERDLSFSKVRIFHQFENYLILHVQSFDTRAKTENPYIFSKDIELDFLLSQDGKVIREISDAVSYHDDLYLFKNDKEFGMKGIVDGQIYWKKKTSPPDEVPKDMEDSSYNNFEKEFFQTSQSYLIQRVMVVKDMKFISTISLLNYQDGRTIWTKSLPLRAYKYKELEGYLYIVGSEDEYNPEQDRQTSAVVVRINSKDPKETKVDLFPFSGNWGGGWFEYYIQDIISINHQVYLFFRDGFAVLENKRASFFDYSSAVDPVLRNYWTTPYYWTVSVKTYNQSILVIFTNDSEEVGGIYLVFKIAKQGK
jgi:hypothetical protein